MSKQFKDLPEAVKPYVCHGVDLTKGGGGQWVGDCPYCGKEKKFMVNSSNGLFDCKVCALEGNAITFLTDMAKEFCTHTTKEDFENLSQNRGFTKVGRTKYQAQVPIATLKGFQIGKNPITDEWCIPCISDKGTVRDLRHWKNGQMMATAGCKTQLGGEDRIDRMSSSGTVWLCEGEWDAVVMQWLLDELERDGDAVCWLPGATIFKEPWAQKFSGRRVVAIFDADRAGDDGAEKAKRLLEGVVRELRFVNWPESRPEGYDLRDYIVKSFSQDIGADVIMESLETLMDMLPRRSKNGTVKDEDAEDEEAPITINELLDVFKKHILMNGEMEDALRVIMATALSIDVPGDPLWMYIVGPPGAGKTLLLSALQGSTRCIFVSTLTPHSLVSGWKGGDDSDPSLIPKLKGRTFVAKDFTEVLTMPPNVQDEIFSTLRGAYDGLVQRPYGNGVMREYKDCQFSMLAGVTNAVHGHKKASLGERFLNFQMTRPLRQHADEVIMAAIANVGRERQMETDMQEASRRFLSRRVEAGKLPTIAEHFQRRLIALVQLIAILRAQVERDFRGDELLYRPEPESGTRLAKQLTKLAITLAMVNDDTEVTERTFKLVERVAYNTAHGFHLDVISALMRLGGSATKQEIQLEADLPATTLARRMDDLSVLKVIKGTVIEKVAGETGGRPSRLYELHADVADLWASAKETEYQTTPAGDQPLTRRRKPKRKAAPRRKSRKVKS